MSPSSQAVRARKGIASALRAVTVAAAVCTAGWPPPAIAETPGAVAAGHPALVIVADAPASRQVVAGLGAWIQEPWHLADDGAVRRALAAAGQRTGTGVALGSAAGRAALARKAQAAAAEAGAGAVLFIRATPRRGGSVATVLLITPGSAEPALDTTVDLPATDASAVLFAALRPALAQIARLPSSGLPAAPGSAVVGTPPSDAPNRGGRTGEAPIEGTPQRVPLGRADRAIFVFSAGGGTGARVFRNHDGLSPQLRSYDLPASPNLVLAAELYPFARTSVPVLRGLGITGGLAHALGVSSQTSAGASVSTTWTRAEGDLRLRLAFGDDEHDGARFLLGLHGGVVMERFGFSGDPTLVAWLPDVSYLFWRAGADGRLRAGPVGLLAGFSYLPAIAGGALADRFRETSFAAVEFDAGLAVPLARIFVVRRAGSYTRVFYAFNPIPGDLYVAGGALDHLIRANLLATLLL